MNGLVLEGGGMRGLYTAGVLDLFLDRGIVFDYVIGVSAGACNAVSYLTGQRKRSYHVNIDYVNDKRYMSVKNFLKDGCLFGEEMMFHTIPEELLPFDYEAFCKSPVKFLSCSTSCLTGKPVYHQVADLKKDYTPVLASMSLPLVSRMVAYQGDLLLDGGMADPIPVNKALQDGCDKLVVVLTRERGYRKTPESTLKLAKIVYRKYPKLVKALKERHTIYNAQLDLCDKLQREGRAIVLCPEEKVTIKRTEKDVQKLDALYRSGYTEAQKQAKKLEAFL